jgi:pyruvate formate lyase activating enzyme
MNDDALLWEPLEGGCVLCSLCAHRCTLAEGRAGLCGVRVNRGGRMRSLVRDRFVSGNVDPIEKKPLFHFLPGSLSFSVATEGCNFRCEYCQNWQISQHPPGGEIRGMAASPPDILRAALESGCRSISYTYTEPTVFFETCLGIGTLAREAGLKNVFVTNGYMTGECVQAAKPFLDAANADLKFFRDETYRRVCGARLGGVLEGIRALFEAGVWLELTTLLVPGLNDSEEELSGLARWIASLSPDIPWHLSRFHPDYKMERPGPTPVQSLRRALEIGRNEGLRFVYVGNVPGESGENTFCPSCGTMLLERIGFSSRIRDLREDRCGRCGQGIPGIWHDPVAGTGGSPP